jgi:hypothetical protein
VPSSPAVLIAEAVPGGAGLTAAAAAALGAVVSALAGSVASVVHRVASAGGCSSGSGSGSRSAAAASVGPSSSAAAAWTTASDEADCAALRFWAKKALRPRATTKLKGAGEDHGIGHHQI